MASKKKVTADYGDDAIDALIGLEAVRVRPAMYVGELPDVAYTLFREAVENSCDEATAGYADLIKVNISEQGARLTVEDNGRGIPIGENAKARNTDGSPMSNLKAIFTMLHAGGKFGKAGSGYTVSGGLHGVGISVVNALSYELEATTIRDGQIRTLNTSQSIPCYLDDYNQEWMQDENYDPPARPYSGDKEHGTKVSFTIDTDIPALEGYGDVFPLDQIRNRLHEFSFLIPGLTIELYIEDELAETFYAESSAEHFQQMIQESGFELLHSEPIHLRTDNPDGTFFDATLGFTDSTYRDAVKAYTNTIFNPQKGKHVEGFLDGMYAALKEGVYDPETEEYFDFDQQDVVRGSFLLLHIGITNAAYSSQDKKKLVTKSAYQLCYDKAQEAIGGFIENHYDEALTIVKAAHTRYINRRKSAKVKELTSKITLNSGKGGVQHVLIKGYTECHSKDPNVRELYIVEGDSASGNLKKRRNKQTQAIQRLKGKIPNAAKQGESVILGNNELHSIIQAIGCGVQEICEAKRSRFSKIIIATDADPDGAHIRSELLAFFHMYMRPLIDAGLLYVAVPPLFGATNRVKWPGYTAYGQSVAELAQKIYEDDDKAAQLEQEMSEDELREYLQRQGWNVTRYKGLGEMSDLQTYETLLSEDRILLQITAGDFDEDDTTVVNIMGKESIHRRNMLGGVPSMRGVYEGF